MLHTALMVIVLWPPSFSVDMTGLLGYAEDFFNSLFPAFVPAIGIQLGGAIILMVVAVIAAAIKFRK